MKIEENFEANQKSYQYVKSVAAEKWQLNEK